MFPRYLEEIGGDFSLNGGPRPTAKEMGQLRGLLRTYSCSRFPGSTATSPRPRPDKLGALRAAFRKLPICAEVAKDLTFKISWARTLECA
jgi:hypothetical protein